MPAAAARPLVVDGDGHVYEPVDAFREFVSAEFRDRAPKLWTDAEGIQRISVDNQDILRGARQALPVMLGGAAVPDFFTRDILKLSADDVDASAWDPHKRLALMSREGIDIAVLYPSLGLTFQGVQDRALARELHRAYTRWLAAFCAADPRRLIGAAAIYPVDVAAAIDDVREAARLGYRVAFVRPNRYAKRNWYDRALDPFYAALQEHDMVLAFHEATDPHVETAAIDRFESLGFRHAVSHPFEQMLACMSVLLGGVAARFPRLRFAFLEAGCSWLPFWLERLDEHWEKQITKLHRLYGIPMEVHADVKQPPSEYFYRQCVVSIESDEKPLQLMSQIIGEDCTIWGSDFPHVDASYPDAPLELWHRPDVSDALKRKIFIDNPTRFYKLAPRA